MSICLQKRSYVLRKMKDGSRKSISVDLEFVLQNPESKSNISLKEYDIVKVMSIDDFHNSYFVKVLLISEESRRIILWKRYEIIISN